MPDDRAPVEHFERLARRSADPWDYASLLAAAVFAWVGAPLRRPDLEAWLGAEEPALESPALERSRAPAPFRRRRYG